MRPAKGLLGGMRALPSSDWRTAAAWGDDSPAPPITADWLPLGAVTHGFTHFELVLSVAAVRLPARPALAGDWVNVEEVLVAGLPTLFQKAATLARAQLTSMEIA